YPRGFHQERATLRSHSRLGREPLIVSKQADLKTRGDLRSEWRRRSSRPRIDRAHVWSDQGAYVVSVREPKARHAFCGPEQKGPDHPGRSDAGWKGDASHRQALQVKRAP